jgi:spoIIIJ-associated protein
MKAAAKENAVLISLEGETVGIIIGHRGETLDSIQYLTSLAASNNGGGYFKVTINIGNYREKREEALVNLAKRVSEQVIRTGRCRSLEPMNPYERRIIHTAVQEINGVVSNSFGEGTARRVVIGIEGGEMRPPRKNGRDFKDGGRRRAPSKAAPASASNREPKKDNDAPLYGKIN